MSKFGILGALAVVFMIGAPLSVQAGEGAKPSYAMKKQNRVHFKSDDVNVDEAVSATVGAQPDYSNPASIEPAAGDFEPTIDAQDESALADTMKLPRK